MKAMLHVLLRDVSKADYKTYLPSFQNEKKKWHKTEKYHEEITFPLESYKHIILKVGGKF